MNSWSLDSLVFSFCSRFRLEKMNNSFSSWWFPLKQVRGGDGVRFFEGSIPWISRSPVGLNRRRQRVSLFGGGARMRRLRGWLSGLSWNQRGGYGFWWFSAMGYWGLNMAWKSHPNRGWKIGSFGDVSWSKAKQQEVVPTSQLAATFFFVGSFYDFCCRFLDGEDDEQ